LRDAVLGRHPHCCQRNLSSNLELEKNTMSVAEKLIAQGRAEGFAIGLAEGREAVLSIGRIQQLEEFLDLPGSSGEALAALSLEELKAMQERLHREYELRFERR
jgi:hypothetical protein